MLFAQIWFFKLIIAPLAQKIDGAQEDGEPTGIEAGAEARVEAGIEAGLTVGLERRVKRPLPVALQPA